MLGFGRGSGGNGLKVWVVDIRFPHPQQVGVFALSNQFANSPVEYEHKAFTIYPQYNLVIIPLRNAPNFNGALTLIMKQGFSQWTFKPYLIEHYQFPDVPSIFGDRSVDRGAYIR